MFFPAGLTSLPPQWQVAALFRFMPGPLLVDHVYFPDCAKQAEEYATSQLRRIVQLRLLAKVLHLEREGRLDGAYGPCSQASINISSSAQFSRTVDQH